MDFQAAEINIYARTVSILLHVGAFSENYRFSDCALESFSTKALGTPNWRFVRLLFVFKRKD
jgi:hypothetical protein